MDKFTVGSADTECDWRRKPWVSNKQKEVKSSLREVVKQQTRRRG